MKVSPLVEENADLRRRIHIMNAEKFVAIHKEHSLLVEEAISLVSKTSSDELKSKINTLRGRGGYCAVRAEQNFARYTKNLEEVNSSLRRIISELKLQH